MAALAPFGKVADLLSELLPINGARNAGTAAFDLEDATVADLFATPPFWQGQVSKRRIRIGTSEAIALAA